MASLRSLKVDGYAEVFRVCRNGIFKRILLYGFCVASQHAASMYWDILHIDLKTAFLQGET